MDVTWDHKTQVNYTEFSKGKKCVLWSGTYSRYIYHLHETNTQIKIHWPTKITGMRTEKSELLLENANLKIMKRDTVMRMTIPSKTKLEVTL
jgi:hypothetical protein